MAWTQAKEFLFYAKSLWRNKHLLLTKWKLDTLYNFDFLSSPVFPTLLDQNSPIRRNFAPKSPPLKMAKISSFCCNIFAKTGQNSPISPADFANFAQNRPFFKDAKNRPNFAGDFCKKVVASLRPKIAHLAKNRHGWERCSSLILVVIVYAKKSCIISQLIVGTQIFRRSALM